MPETDFFMLLRGTVDIVAAQMSRLRRVCGELVRLPLRNLQPKRLSNNILMLYARGLQRERNWRSEWIRLE